MVKPFSNTLYFSLIFLTILEPCVANPPKSHPKKQKSVLTSIERIKHIDALINAAQSDDTSKVQSLLSIGVNPNGTTSLHNLETDTDMVRHTALIAAAGAGNLDVIKLLVAHGADLNQKETDIVPSKAGVDNFIGITALMVASSHGHTDVVQFLSEKGANVNAADNFGNTALNNAATEGYADTVLVLLKAGAKIDAGDKIGMTALAWAADKGRTDTVKTLLSAGAQVDSANDTGETPLLDAISHGYTDVVQLLLNSGANVNMVATLPGGFQETAVGQAEGYPDVMELLLNYGANPNSVQDGCPIIISAAKNGDMATVKALADKKADLNAKDKSGYTALMYAAAHGSVPIVSILLDRGADIEASDRDRFTALILAAREGQTAVVQLLIDKGANVNARAVPQYGAGSITALSLAEDRQHTDVAELLRAAGAQ